MNCVVKPKNMLIVEDNPNITESLEYILEKEGFNVKIVKTKKEAISCIDKYCFDMFLLDIQLPDGNGYEVCKYVKMISDKPIIFISARCEESNIVYGLDMGADDYITKPFRSAELTARIKSVMRRYYTEFNKENIINYKNISVRLDSAKVYKNSKEIYLTNLEYKILLTFIEKPNRVVTRNELLENIWDINGNFVNDNTLSVYIKRIRKKLSENINKPIIKTIRGIGYILS